MLSRKVLKQILSGSLAQLQCRFSFWSNNVHTERPNEKGQVVFSQEKVPYVGHKIYAPWPTPLDMPRSGLCRKDLPESHK